jgi:hypothetical protein
MEESGKEIVIYNQEFALKQIIESLHPEASEFTSMGFSQGMLSMKWRLMMMEIR